MRFRNTARVGSWCAALGGVLMVVLAGVGGAGAEAPTSEPASSVEGQPAAAKESVHPGRQIVVYYFHGARRCNTCRTIEAQAESVIKSRFARELESGALTWKVVNYDEPATEHFKEDFGLVSSSLVVVEMSKGAAVRFEVLQKAWSLVRDESGFEEYVHRSVRAYVG